MTEVDVAVIGAGVVGCSIALGAARRGAVVVVLEAEPEPGLAASGTNSGILHTGFDSVPGELETEMILRSAALRDPVLDALGVPLLRCGALLRDTPPQLAAAAARNGVEATVRDDGALEVPGEAVTDPVRFTLGVAAAAERHGADIRTSAPAVAIEAGDAGLVVEEAGGDRIACRTVVNCAGLRADDVARLIGDDSFEVYPRKGEFLVFDPPADDAPDQILLPVPTKRTKGMLVFPTVDGMVVAGPTAVDGSDKSDWSVRPEARDEIVRSVTPIWPAAEGLEPVAAYAGLRPAGRGVNYVIGPSAVDPRLVNVAAIRSTGLTASLGIAERVCSLLELGPERPLIAGAAPELPEPWWRRTARYRAAA
ncbi:MAG: glycerol-3-phosphate dehydrogenase [Thermoleophilaceae bacterium]|nr:glycerol-3-phosphate dehydrogenase [Thermoleophilaceae bacterium]